MMMTAKLLTGLQQILRYGIKVVIVGSCFKCGSLSSGWLVKVCELEVDHFIVSSANRKFYELSLSAEIPKVADGYAASCSHSRDIQYGFTWRLHTHSQGNVIKLNIYCVR